MNELDDSSALRDVLTGDNLDTVLGYQADDETLEETLNRVLSVVPHNSRFEAANVDPTDVGDETAFVLEWWYDETDLLESYVYPTPMALANRYPKGALGYDPEEAEDAE